MSPAHATNRRAVLGMTAMTVAGLAWPSTRGFGEASGAGSVIDTLAGYMGAAGARALPPDVAEAAKHHLLDTLASMVSGSELLPGQSAQRYIRAYGGQGGATIAGTSLTAAPADAALANGVMAHADETDDSHNASRSHPGCAVVPAALAVGEQRGVDGAGFLRAVTLGYDVGPRVVLAMGGADWSYQTSLATHSIAGTFGAAAAAACAAGPTPDALGLGLRRATVVRHRRLAARHRSYREGVRVCRDDGAQRRDRGARGADGVERRRRHLLRC
jgi:2-methylcitrate dehydratase PrpD